jgi:hypothetical protein
LLFLLSSLPPSIPSSFLPWKPSTTELLQPLWILFWDRVSQNCSGWLWVCNPPASASWVAGISDAWTVA